MTGNKQFPAYFMSTYIGLHLCPVQYPRILCRSSRLMSVYTFFRFITCVLCVGLLDLCRFSPFSGSWSAYCMSIFSTYVDLHLFPSHEPRILCRSSWNVVEKVIVNFYILKWQWRKFFLSIQFNCFYTNDSLCL